MTVSLKHAFTSAVADGGDTSLVQPSNWNAEHNLTMATARLLGRTTAGTGSAEEISAGTALSLSAGTLAVSTVPVANGGTGATTANAGLTGLTTLTSTATAAGTTVLTNTSTYFQLFTGTTTQTITLPVTSTLATGWTFHIINNSTGNLTVNSSGGNAVITVIPGTTAMVTCIGTALTTAADWEAGLTDFSTYTGTGSNVLANDPLFSTGIRIGTGGTLAAGSIASNANWGMWLQAPQSSPALGDFVLLNSAGTVRLGINTSGALGVGSSPSYGTSGQALVSGGTGAAPSWATLGVAGGGTGITTATAYSLIAAGTTSTGAFQSVGTGTSGQILISGGSGALPSFSSTITNPTVTNYTETVNALGSGTSFSPALSSGTIITLTTNGTTTITLPASSAGKSFIIIITYGGAHSLVWAGGSTIKWANGVTPTATSTLNKIDIFAFFQDGTNTYATTVGQNF